MDEKNKNNTSLQEQQDTKEQEGHNRFPDTDTTTDRDEGNTDNGELGGNFATFNGLVRPDETGKQSS